MKRPVAICIFIFMCISVLSVPVLAATSAKNVGATATLSTDGSYTMLLEVQPKVDQVMDSLSFPVPSDAKNIELFGSRPGTHRARGAIQVEIPSRYLGATAVTIYYSREGQVIRSEKEGFLELEVPLLSGFQYPVEAMTFSVKLPGSLDPATDPVKFLSDTHGQMIETYLNYTIQNDTLTGTLVRPLNDGASLILHLTVPETMFPQAKLESWSVSFDDYAMYALAGIALVYWLVFLRCLPPKRIRSANAPEGLSAGELGTALIGQGGDLTMMVLSWAQLGYILIHLDQHGRVMLHKRMEMGNERSPYERKCFHLLFGKQSQISGTGMYYARLWHKVAALRPENRGYFQRRSGSVRLFRLILALVGALAGISLGIALAGQVWLEVLLAIILAFAGFASSFVMQDFVCGIHLRHRYRLILGLGLAAAWLLLGNMVGELVVSAWMVVCQLLGGLAYGYGGMRTDAGRLAMSRILGLRRYFTSVSKADIQHTSRQQPEYFFDMAPYAAALGVDENFAKRFGGKRLPSCPYLTTGMDGHMSAWDWDQLLRKAVSAMDAKARRLPFDRLLGRQ